MRGKSWLAVGVCAGLWLGVTAGLFAKEDTSSPLKGRAADLYAQCRQEGRFFQQAEKLHPEIRPTTDGRSFFLIWRGSPAPQKWIVSLHGAGKPPRGFATDDLAVWHRHVQNRDVGLICLQWWMGSGDGPEGFYSPLDMYREIDRLLTQLNVRPGNAMLHGFSRGSANSYAVMAIDHGRGRKFFSLAVANSGGMSADYLPNRQLERDEFGERPLQGTRWITVAGKTDPNPDRDGIAAMRRTATWLEGHGAQVVDAIEDPKFGHGALHLNPANARRVLDRFLAP